MNPSVNNKFFKLFWSNPHCQEIFLMHKEQLLEKSEIDLGPTKKSYYLQRFVLSNSLKQNHSVERIEERIENNNIDVSHSLELKSVKNFNEQEISRYFNEKFGYSLSLVTQKLNGGNIAQVKFLSEFVTSLLSEERLIKFLQKYSFIPKDVSSFAQLTSSLERLFHQELQKILSPERLSDIFASFDEMAAYYNNFNFNSLIESSRFYTDNLYGRDNFNERLYLFDSLYEAGVVLGGCFKAHYECTNCPPNTFSGNVTLNVAPSKIKLKCPNCGKEVFYLVPYKIDDNIYEMIISKDGMLCHAIANLLATNKISFQLNVPIGGDIETDIQIVQKDRKSITDIVEIKMFKTNRNDDTMLGNLRTGLKQFLDARRKLIAINGNFKNVRFHFITNLSEEALYRRIKEDFESELRDIPLFLYKPTDFKHYVENQLQKIYK